MGASQPRAATRLAKLALPAPWAFIELSLRDGRGRLDPIVCRETGTGRIIGLGLGPSRWDSDWKEGRGMGGLVTQGYDKARKTRLACALGCHRAVPSGRKKGKRNGGGFASPGLRQGS
jgi:hypothetical protein